jgi:endonuclease-3
MPLPLKEILAALEECYGVPPPPEITDPFQQILWENLAYLASDERRQAAFDVLRDRVGLDPEEISLASPEMLTEICALGGIYPELRAERLQDSASLVIEKYDGDLSAVLKLPLPKAKSALRQFPVIGEPGAEKILLFARAYPILALDSNGLRALVRIGYGEEAPSYSTTYKSAKNAAADQIIEECPWLISAYQLLRRHGQELCRRTMPHCHECPLSHGCAYALKNAN